MNDLIRTILLGVIEREGGFTQHPLDRGGPTNLGITQSTLADWRNGPVTVEDVRELTIGEALDIYHDRYVTRPGFDCIPDPFLLSLVVDCAVLQGPGRAVKWLQASVGVEPDGVLGPLTKAAIATADPRPLAARICASRIRSFGRLITDKPDQAVFAAGWMNRAAEFVETLGDHHA